MPRVIDRPPPSAVPAGQRLPARSPIRVGSKWDEKMAQLREAGLALDYAAGQLVASYRPLSVVGARLPVAAAATRLSTRPAAPRAGGRQAPSREA